MSPPIVPTSFSLAEKPTEPRATLSYPYGSIHHPTAHIATSTGSDFNRTLTKMAVFSFLFTFLTAIIYTSTFARPATATIAFLPTNQFKQWAQYSPWYPVEPYRPPPRLCKVTQVNLIQRHGARFPTSGSSARIISAISKLASAQVFVNPRLAFMTNYSYDLGSNDLVEFGASQSVGAGETHYRRYAHLFSQDNIPFVRASGSERVILSAQNWTTGVSLASHHQYNPVLSVVLPENLNDTLDDSMCPNVGDSDVQTNQWLDIYGPNIAARLNTWAPGANLTGRDIFDLMSLCPFDSLAKQEYSPFCRLFTEDDFRAFEYSGDLDKYYGTGYGQELGPVQGVGYINELIARLTGTAVQDNTQTNRTLDSDPETFPLDRKIYADFSHDNQMIAIYAAMGLFPQKITPDPINPQSNRTWYVSRMTPFSAQMVTEKIQCGKTTYVRVLVNDAVQPLKFCGASSNGMCELDAFVASQVYARSNSASDFEKCFD